MTGRPSFPWFRVTLFFYWSIRLALADQVNITIDDTDGSIVYQPSGSWHASSAVCSVCLNPDIRNAYLNTYHDGTHVLPTTDDAPEEVEAEEKEKEKEKGKKGKSGGEPTKRDITRTPHRRLDSDDPGFVDPPVTAEYNFTGSAIYLYCIQPLGVPLVDTTPTAMNLSFTLDNTSYGHFFHSGSQSASGYLPQVNVFSQKGLAEIPHILQVNIEPGSVFLFDYLVYTRTEASSTNGSPSPTPLAQDSPSPTADPSVKRNNIATFAGAVGGSVGVLAIISIGLAFSIIRRRRNYERRERLARSGTRDSLHTNSSDDSPPMFGPAPFTPRFFPGTTLIPSDPPPYIESLEPGSASSSLRESSSPMLSSSLVPASYNAHLAQRRGISYADIPPASPPPPLEDNIMIAPPPPFVVAVTTPSDVETTSLILPPGIADNAPLSSERVQEVLTSGHISPTNTSESSILGRPQETPS